ncbi:MAG: hypothetical protein US89_C0018G0006 [Candidatus Peregrinibacteria bacterium GW2011_GWF2_38_29]|nr:MAG: hypothetical protein US89_C0018G0006 [Candidatus Peregrinibacteria bacterium GW2011_GWF2_38_29]HBB02450.1 hypothetical protein [Candidatus Peregrinibacteria bacterium]
MCREHTAIAQRARYVEAGGEAIGREGKRTEGIRIPAELREDPRAAVARVLAMGAVAAASQARRSHGLQIQA